MMERRKAASRQSLILLGAVILAMAAGARFFFEDPNSDPLASLGAAGSAETDRSATYGTSAEPIETQDLGDGAPASDPQASAPQSAQAGGGDHTFQQTNESWADSEPDALFDYYVLALSWSPTQCAIRPDDEECGSGRRFVLHGLWPNFEEFFVNDCDTDHPNPSGGLLREFAYLTGGPRQLARQWRRHGTCTGFSPRAYFETSRDAYRAVVIPPALSDPDADQRYSAREIEAMFIDANPSLTPQAVVIRCDRDDRLQDVRICLDQNLRPRACGRGVPRDCRASRVMVPAPD